MPESSNRFIISIVEIQFLSEEYSTPIKLKIQGVIEFCEVIDVKN